MIDAHVHLWRLGEHGCTWPTAADGSIHRDFAWPDLLPLLDAYGIERVVLVQSQESAADTDWLLELAAAEPRVAGVVGWAELGDLAAVAALAARARIVGLRPMVQHRPAGWYDDPALDPALAVMAERGLVLDALVRPQHLPALDRLAERHPRLPILVDHAAKPAIAAGGIEPWRAAIAPLARRSSVHVKLSGLLTEAGVRPGADAIRPYVEALLGLFGPERLVWGSDWPVLGLDGTYPGWLAMAREMVPAAAHEAVFGANAARLYRLEAE